MRRKINDELYGTGRSDGRSSSNFQKQVKEFISFFKTKIDEYDELVTGNIIFQNRMKGVGVLSKEDAISYGCTGPTARGSGVNCDIRKLYPYEVYDKLQFDEIIETGGDCFARYMVRYERNAINHCVLLNSLSIIFLKEISRQKQKLS